MFSPQVFRSLICGLSVALVGGCSGHPARVVAPDSATGVDATSEDQVAGAHKLASFLPCDPAYLGPVLTISVPGVRYTYPTGGYSTGPEAEVAIELVHDRQVKFRWSGDGSSGCTEIHSYRWALDIVDLFDETPRIDEDTDLAHWSVWTRATSVKLDAFPLAVPPASNVHYFYIDARDQLGYRSLGIFRITVGEAGNRPEQTAERVADREF